MTSPIPQDPQLDWSRLAFPTDQVSVATLRRAHPEKFAGSDAALDAKWKQMTLFATICLERVLAEKAFAAAAGVPDPHADDDRDELIEALDSDYRRYGISRGLHQTRQLVRRFESAATAQAGGRSR